MTRRCYKAAFAFFFEERAWWRTDITRAFLLLRL